MPIYDKEKEREYIPGSHDDMGMSDDDRAAEIARLEDDFAAPSATKADSKEQTALGGKTGLFNPGKDEPGNSRLKSLGNKLLGSRKKKLLAGGGIAGVGVGGLMLMILSGPFHAIHLAQILMKDNFGNEKSSNLRINALYRYSRTGSFGETRLSYLGSKVFRSTQADLAKIGVAFQESPQFGNARTITIEIDKHPATRNLPPEQAKAALVKEFAKAGISEADIHNISGNKVGINSKKIGVSATRAIAKNSISYLDGGKVTGWVKYRAFTKFYNLPSMFHPLKKADRKLQDRVEGRISKQDRKKAEQERQKKIKERNNAQIKSLTEKLKSKTSGVKAGAATALLITGGMCMARSAGSDAVAYNRAAIVGPQVVGAMDKISVGSQTQSGIDFDVEQLGGVVDAFYDDNGKTIWDAKALNAKTDPNNPKGEDLPPEYAQAFHGGGKASELEDLGGLAGAAACSSFGIAVQFVAGLALVGTAPFTGGATAAAWSVAKIGATAAVGVAVMTFLQKGLTEMLKEEGIPDDISAPVKGNLLGYGSREAANVDARASGGIELSSEESAALDREEQLQSATEFAQRPLLARMFDANDYRSMASRVIDNQSPSPGGNLENLASGLAKLPFSFGNTFAALFPRVHAQTEDGAAVDGPYDYGFNRYGIPQEILDNPDYDDPYENSRIVAEMLDKDDDDSEEYIDRAKACFGVEIKKGSNGWAVIPDSEVNPNSSEYEDGDCANLDDEMWPRIMLFVRDTREMEAAACYEGEQDACRNNSGESTGGTGQFSIMSYNVLGADKDGPSWSTRKELIFNVLKGTSPDIIGLQEMNEDEQFDDLEAGLPDYELWDGGKKNDGGGRNERPIMWKTELFEKVDGGLYYHQRYSDNEKQPAPWVKLKNKNNGSELFVFNYHGIAHDRNAEKKIKGAKDLVKAVDEIAGDSAPVAIVGDFNSKTGQFADPIIKAAGFVDTFEVAETKINGEYNTHSGIGPTKKEGKHIDHIYFRPNTPVKRWELIINSDTENASDHRPLLAVIGIKDPEQERTDTLPMGKLCNIAEEKLGESSGLAASQKHPGIVYTHNDEKGPIYAIDSATCKVMGKINVNGQRSDPDPEAIQVDHTTGKIWFGDIGNGHPGQPKSMTDKKPSLKYPSTPARIIVFDEPNDLNATISNAQTYDITYQGGMQNSEALLVNPKTGQGYIINKQATSTVYKLPHPIASGQATDTGVRIPQWVSDATFTNDGKWVLIRYVTATDSGPTSVLVYDAATWKQAGTITVPKVDKGESITMDKGAPSFLIGSEGLNSPLIRVPLPAQFGGSDSVLGGVSKIDLKNWKLNSLPCKKNDDGKLVPRDIKQPELANYSDAWYKKNADGSIRFYVNSSTSGACTTGSSKNYRSELREMDANNNQEEATWYPNKGTHQMLIKQKIVSLNSSKGMTIGQIHDYDKSDRLDDFTVFRLEGTKLYAFVGGSKSDNRTKELGTVAPNQVITVGFRVEANRVTFLYDLKGGSNFQQYAVTYPSGSKGAYFKAGNYLQGEGQGELIMLGLEVTHK